MKKMFKRGLSLFLTLVLCAGMLPLPVLAADDNLWTDYASPAAQTADGVYEISTAAQLAWLAKGVNNQSIEQISVDFEQMTEERVVFRLTADLDLTDHLWMPIGYGKEGYVDTFRAVFDGGGHTISGLRVGSAAEPYHESRYAGLFGLVYSGGVRDLRIANAAVYADIVSETETYTYAGLLAGAFRGYKEPMWHCAADGAVYTCGTTGDSDCAAAGGLAGEVIAGTVDACRAEVTLHAPDAERGFSLGGITGYVGSDAKIVNCAADVVLDAPENGNGCCDAFFPQGSGALLNSVARVSGGTQSALDGGQGTRRNALAVKTDAGSEETPCCRYHNGNGEGSEVASAELRSDEFLATLNEAAAALVEAETLSGALTWSRSGGMPELAKAGMREAFTVTFSSAGRTLQTQTVLDGEAVSAPEAPERKGYTFLRWYTDDPGTSYDFDTPVTGALTICAAWDANSFSAYFDSMGGSYVYPQPVKQDEKLTRPEDPVKKGFIFAGWFSDDAYTTEWDFDSDTADGETTLYAKWREAGGVAVSGRITDAADGSGISGASVALSNGQNARTDQFGYYRISGVRQGSYDYIMATANGYEPASQNSFAVGTVPVGYDAALSADGSGSRSVSVYVSVRCVNSGIMLGGVTVRAIRQDGEGGDTKETDENGFALFTGLPEGTYVFEINKSGRPGWESYTSGATPLNGSYNLNCALKPNYQTLRVSVIGYDPVTERDNAPLKGKTVTLIGVNPGDKQQELSVLQGETDENGVLTVDKLVPITWLISCTELGYETAEETVYSAADGKLTKDAVTLRLPFIDSGVTVALHSFYNDPDLFKKQSGGSTNPKIPTGQEREALSVTLTGVPGTLTEGITRESAPDQNGNVAFSRLFPGQYYLSASGSVKRYVSIPAGDGKEIYDDTEGTRRGPKFFFADFHGTGMTHVALGRTAAQFTDTLEVEPAPVSFSGTLYKSDMREDGSIATEALPNTTITIKPSEYYRLNGEAAEGHTIQTDADGRYSVTLWPGLYGVEVEERWQGYFGGRLTYHEGATSANYDDGSARGWPCAGRWTGSVASARTWLSSRSKETYADIAGMNLSSGTVVADLELAEKKFTYWLGGRTDTSDNGIYMETAAELNQITGCELPGAAVREHEVYQNVFHTVNYHTESRDATVTMSGKASETRDMTDKQFPTQFNALAPGNYSFTYRLSDEFSHLTLKEWEPSGHDWVDYGGTRQLTFFDFPAPGILPDYFPADYVDVRYRNDSYLCLNPWPLSTAKDNIHIDFDEDKPGHRTFYDLYDEDATNGELYFKVWDHEKGAWADGWEYGPSSAFWGCFVAYTSSKIGGGDKLFFANGIPRQGYDKRDQYKDPHFTSIPDGTVTFYFCAARGSAAHKMFWGIYDPEKHAGPPNRDLWFSVVIPESGRVNCMLNFANSGLSQGVTILSQADIDRLLNPRGIQVVGYEAGTTNELANVPVSVTVSEGNTFSSAGGVYAGQTCSSSVKSVTVESPEWQCKGTANVRTTISTGTTVGGDGTVTTDKTEIFLVPLVRTLYTGSLQILDELGNSVRNASVTMIGQSRQDKTVYQTDAYGMVKIGRTESYWGGSSNVVSGLTYQDYKIYISARGYEPLSGSGSTVVSTLTAAELVAGGTKTITIGRADQPGFAPNTESLRRVSIDRKGGFLPGVSFTGSSDTVTFFTESSISKLHATVEALVSIPDGSKFEALYLVDRKSFENADYSGAVTALDVPNTSGEAYNPGLALQWIDDLVSGKKGNVYYECYTNEARYALEKVGTSSYRFSTWIPLWELPPDGFEPTLIAVTDKGAVRFCNVVYEKASMNTYDTAYHSDSDYADAADQLIGIRTSGTFSQALRLISVAANAQALGTEAGLKYLDVTLPAGAMVLYPTFSASIEEANGFLSYSYELGIELDQGKVMPSGARASFTSLAPSILGVGIAGKMLFSVDGKEVSTTCGGDIMVKNNEMDANKYLPGIAKAVKVGFPITAEFDQTRLPEANVSLTETDKLNKKNEVLLQTIAMSGNGKAYINAEWSVFGSLGFLPPPVGPVLLTLSSSGALDAGIKAKLGTGVEDTFRFSRENGGEGVTAQADITLGALAGGGLYIKALGGALGADGIFKISGDSNSFLSDMMTVNASISTDGLAISSIEGKFTCTLSVLVRTWFINGKGEWDFGTIPFKYVYNTETQFELQQISVNNNIRSRDDFDASVFHAMPKAIVSDLLPIGGYAADASAPGTFVYTDMASKGGAMRLMLSSCAGGDTWNEPAAIAQTDGLIPAFDIISLGDGRSLAVWTEIAAADMRQTCPPSAIRYSVGTVENGAWTGSVQTLAELPAEVASKLLLVSDASGVSLAALRTAEGALAEKLSVSGYRFDGTGWSAARPLAEDQPLYSVSACAADGTVLVSFVTADNILHVLSWKGASVTESVFDACGFDTAMVSDGTAAYLASEAKKGLSLRRWNGAWQEPGVVTAALNTGNLALALSGSLVIVSWTGENDTVLYQAAYDPDSGSLEGEAKVMDTAAAGAFRDSTLFLRDGTIRLMAVLDGDNDDLNVYLGSETPGGPKISSASVSGATISYQIENLPAGAKLVAARYDGGRMTDVKIVDDPGTSGSVTLSGSGTLFKLFLMDSSGAIPLCKAWTSS